MLLVPSYGHHSDQLLHRADETQAGRNSCPATVAILGFQFGLYHAVVTLIYVSNQSRIIVISTLVSECAKCLTDQPRVP